VSRPNGGERLPPSDRRSRPRAAIAAARGGETPEAASPPLGRLTAGDHSATALGDCIAKSWWRCDPRVLNVYMIDPRGQSYTSLRPCVDVPANLMLAGDVNTPVAKPRRHTQHVAAARSARQQCCTAAAYFATAARELRPQLTGRIAAQLIVSPQFSNKFVYLYDPRGHTSTRTCSRGEGKGATLCVALLSFWADNTVVVNEVEQQRVVTPRRKG
jgi:hypothetical protein